MAKLKRILSTLALLSLHLIGLSGIPIIARPPILVDKTNFGLVLYNPASFYRFGESSSYWSVKRRSVFLCFSLVNQQHTSDITVHNRTVTNIENTVRAVHSCNSWIFSKTGEWAYIAPLAVLLFSVFSRHHMGSKFNGTNGNGPNYQIGPDCAGRA